MVDRDKIVDFCREYLEVSKFEDYCVNGLQVEGREMVSKIITGASLSEKLIKIAIVKNADLLLVHHGIFIKHTGSLPQFRGILRNRLKLLLENDINLCGFHLPLDAHPVIGNNASLCKLLGIRNIKKVDIGFIGALNKEMPRKLFIDLVNKKLGTKSQVVAGGPDKVKRIAVVSGGSSPEFEKARAAGADTYITGDLREAVVRGAEEIGLNIINAGHYNTEKLGIMNLGLLLAKKFKIKQEFIDIPNDI